MRRSQNEDLMELAKVKIQYLHIDDENVKNHLGNCFFSFDVRVFGYFVYYIFLVFNNNNKF